MSGAKHRAMSEASADETVECPVCETAFDPTAAGGWCTNPDCGEYHHDAAVEDVGETGDEGVTETGESDADEAEAEAEAEAETEEAPEPDAEDVTASNDTVEATEAETDDTDDVGAAAADAAAAASDAGQQATEAGEDVGDGTEDVEGGSEDADQDSAEAVSAALDEAADEEPADDTEPDASAPAEDEEAAAEYAAGEAEPTEIACPDCETTLDADANFCVNCGADVSAVEPGDDGPLTECPSCDAEVSEDDSFCASCGENLDAHRSDEGDDEAETDEAGASEPVESDEDAAAEPAETATADAETETEDSEDAEPETVPDSLVLSVRGTDIDIQDGDSVGRQIRAAITDAGGSEEEAVRVHREHVRFVRESDGFYLVDLGDNPTRVAGELLTKGDRARVTDGDEVELSGVVTATVRYP